MTLINFRGTRFTVRELADIAGLKPSTLHQRLRAGWTVEQAIVTPTPAQRRQGMTSTLDRPTDAPTDAPTDPKGPGVPSVLNPFVGTGAGSTARETPNITFSEKAEA